MVASVREMLEIPDDDQRDDRAFVKEMISTLAAVWSVQICIRKFESNSPTIGTSTIGLEQSTTVVSHSISRYQNYLISGNTQLETARPAALRTMLEDSVGIYLISEKAIPPSSGIVDYATIRQAQPFSSALFSYLRQRNLTGRGGDKTIRLSLFAAHSALMEGFSETPGLETAL